MKRSLYFITLVVAAIFSLSFSGAQCWAGEEKYKMTGDITAIDLSHNTVVIEVPLVGKTFTVGGALSSKAVLKRGGQSAGLADFLVGDRVIVIWEAIEQGHLILSLETK